MFADVFDVLPSLATCMLHKLFVVRCVQGFSMGGGIALQLALRHPTKIAAAFVLSSFMCDDAAAYALLQTPPSCTT